MINKRIVAIGLLAAGPLTAQALDHAALVQRLDSIAGAPVRRGQVPGMAVAVVKGRDTLLLKGYGMADLENLVPVTPQTVFRIGSVTKQFTSAAVMQLVEQGKIGLDDPITKYFPSAPQQQRGVLVRHLLNHTSGIPSYTDIGERFGRVSRLDLSRDSLLGVVAPMPLMFEPGTHFYYNNTGYFMLGVLIERVTGKNYGDYLAERIFSPNGLAATTYCSEDKIIPHRARGYTNRPNGMQNADYIGMELPFAAGSLCSTVGDLVTWTVRLHAGRVVNDASFRAMITPVTLPSKRAMRYGYGLTVDTLGGHRLVEHGGGINGFSSMVKRVPDDSLTVVVLTNASSSLASSTADALTHAALGLPAVATPAAGLDLATTAAERAMYAGHYMLTQTDGSRVSVRIADADGALTMSLAAQAAARMRSQGNGVFVAGTTQRVAFDVVGGKATGFVFGGGSRAREAVRTP